MNLQSGTIIEDRYEILERIGSGGMGSVYKALDIELERNVAIKVIHPDLLSDPENLNRFKQECKCLSTLEHPNILLFYRFGKHHALPYMAVELLEGNSLTQVLPPQGLPASSALSIALQICSGMAYAHSHGIVHRDLKPANVFLCDSNGAQIVKVVDFGLARICDRLEDQHLTKTGSIVGSLFYMSPEQCEGKQADARSDIYSLGCLLYEVLTGSPPFTAESSVGLMYLHVNEAPKPLPEVLHGQPTPEGLQDVIFRAMAKKPSDRYISMNEMKGDIELVIQNRGSEIPSIVYAPSPIRSKKPTVVTALLILCMFLPASVCFWVASTRQASTATAPATSAGALIVSRKLPYIEELARLGTHRVDYLRQWLKRFGNTDLEGTVRALSYLLTDLSEQHAPRAEVLATYKACCDAYNRVPAEYAKGTLDVDQYQSAFELQYRSVRAFEGNEKGNEFVRRMAQKNDLPPSLEALVAGMCANNFKKQGRFKEEEFYRRRAVTGSDPIQLALLSRCLLNQHKTKEATAILNESVSSVYDSISATCVHGVAAELLSQARASDALDLCRLCELDYDRSLSISGQTTTKPTIAELGCEEKWRHYVLVWNALHKLGEHQRAHDYLLSACEKSRPADQWMLLTVLLSDKLEQERLTKPTAALLEQMLAAPLPNQIMHNIRFLSPLELTVATHPLETNLIVRKYINCLSQPGFDVKHIDEQLFLCHLLELSGSRTEAFDGRMQLIRDIKRLKSANLEADLIPVIEFDLIESFVRIDKQAEALAMLNDYCRKYSDSKHLLMPTLVKANVLSSLGRLEEARAELNKLDKLVAQSVAPNAGTLMALSSMHERMNEASAAAFWKRKAEALEPGCSNNDSSVRLFSRVTSLKGE